ncbi:MAG: single-stranded-DNA-specific exonuclease RecJ [Pseudomonadota bacterium]|nr:single-stranded-DNA-specific exonuclease RecJ [Pseudomonadota bacterium]MDE3038061.1 single-stranded-DNA-specific exonuclease RecJ [Pseudomonadota bacterium]
MDAVLATREHSATHPQTGREWVFRDADERVALSLSQRLGLPDVVARILSARGVTLAEADAFLNPSLKISLPDPSHLMDMDAAAERVASGVIAGERIALFGDYDVDGATSTALLARYLRALGQNPIIYIPDRMSEGYGPNAPALLALKERGAALVLTLDGGTLAYEPLQAAYEAGLDVIVIDHHAGAAQKPACYALVNPNRIDETSPHRQLAAVGVAFLLAVAINRKLRERRFFKVTEKSDTRHPTSVTPAVAEPDLRPLLDLVALGTICDVVPLVGVNRALVAQGLKVMAARGNLGIRTLLDLAKVDEKPGVYHAGFIIGPRINAGGRVGRSDLGARLLLTEDEAEALELARELDRHNAERKAIEAMVLEQAFAQAEAADPANPILIVASQGWHPGVIGIVAGRLKERFYKPVAVIALENGIGKASARSVAGFDFGAAVIAAREAGLLVAGGGHAMAAGFTVLEAKIPALTEFLASRIDNRDLGARPLLLDGSLSLAGATAELASSLERLGPFGQGNPHVRLVIRNAVNLKPEWTGTGEHLKTLLIDRLSNARLSAIAFRCVGTPLGDALLSTRGKEINVAGQLRLSEWNGKPQVSLMIEDIAIPA